MKKIVSVIILCVIHTWLQGETTINIGIGTATQRQPFGMWYAYERSAAIYTYADIGSYGNIIKLAWYVGGLTGDPNTCPLKIYLKSTSSSTLSATTWANLVNGAILVYDGVLSFPASGAWRIIDIADFVYSANHLMVLCETNFGWNGAATYPVFRYSSASNKHEYWADNSVPASNGNVNANRPNIQITYNSLSGIYPPSGFMAETVSLSQITLSWTKNSSDDDVMVAYNTTNTFGTPSGNYIAGSTIGGGGTVIYNGPDLTFDHNTGLSQNTTCYYMAWSVHPSTPTYSSGSEANAKTCCDEISMYPYVTDFESSTFPPDCWSTACVPWVRSTAASGFGNGSGSVKADFISIVNGNFIDLVSPLLDLSSMPFSLIKFDHAYATAGTAVDSLQLWISGDSGSTYNWLTSWAGGLTGPLNTGGSTSDPFVPSASQWAKKIYGLPTGTNRLILRGVSAYGNNLYLDNITIYDTACTTLPVSYSDGLDNYTPPTAGCMTVTDNNSDGIKWITTGSYSRSSPNSMYINHSSSIAMNDWFFTPGLELTGGNTYAVNFYYRSGGSPSSEKLEVKWGTAATSAGMTGGQIWSNSSIQNTGYVNGYTTFTPSSTGVYFVGWHGFSVANMSYLSIDDIHIDIASVTWNGSSSDDWSDPLNWTPNVIPTLYQNVTIPSGMPYDPVLYNISLTCGNLTVNSGATFTVTSGSVITINGDMTIKNGAVFDNEGYIHLKGNLVNQNSE